MSCPHASLLASHGRGWSCTLFFLAMAPAAAASADNPPRPVMPRGLLVHRFGPFELDLAARRLSRGGQPIGLSDRLLSIFVTLVEHAGDVLSRGGSRRCVDRGSRATPPTRGSRRRPLRQRAQLTMPHPRRQRKHTPSTGTKDAWGRTWSGPTPPRPSSTGLFADGCIMRTRMCIRRNRA